jgi:hypothetical protein
MPAGLEVTVPDPVPALLTVRLRVSVAVVLNVAVTLRAWLMATVQPPVPLHAPLQPAKVEPEAAVAVSVTLVVEV